MRPLPTSKSCFVCGQLNSIGLRLCFETDGEKVQARFVPDPRHAGFVGVVHGGLVSTVLDEVMVWACGVTTKRFAYCAELNIRFHHPARPGHEILLVGELVANRRDRIFEARAEMRDEKGIVLASASGKYLPVDEAQTAAALADFGISAAELFG